MTMMLQHQFLSSARHHHPGVARSGERRLIQICLASFWRGNKSAAGTATSLTTPSCTASWAGQSPRVSRNSVWRLFPADKARSRTVSRSASVPRVPPERGGLASARCRSAPRDPADNISHSPRRSAVNLRCRGRSINRRWRHRASRVLHVGVILLCLFPRIPALIFVNVSPVLVMMIGLVFPVPACRERRPRTVHGRRCPRPGSSVAMKSYFDPSGVPSEWEYFSA